MPDVQDLMTFEYVMAASDSSSSEALARATVAGQKVIIYNDSTEPAFVTSSQTATPATAVIPTDNTPKQGKTIGSKQTQTYVLPDGTQSLSCIQSTAGTGSIYFSIGEGN